MGPASTLSKLRVEPASLWVLLGPVGSFKSTILELLAGHRHVAAGASVRIGGGWSTSLSVFM